MQKHNLFYLFLMAAVLAYAATAEAALQFLPRYQGSYGIRNDSSHPSRKPVDPYAGKICADFGLLSSPKDKSLYVCPAVKKGPLNCYGSCICLSKFKYDSSNCASLQGESCDGKYSSCCTDTCENYQHESIPEGYEESGRCTDCAGKVKYTIKPKDCGSGYQTCSNGPDIGASGCKSGELTYYDKCKPDTVTCSSPQVNLESYWCNGGLKCWVKN